MSVEPVAAPSAPPGRWRTWLVAARPATLTAAVVPVAVGTACAWSAGGLRAAPALAALLGAVLIQIGTNFVNDFADFEKGADAGDRLGPTRAVQAGWLSTDDMRRGAAVVFALAVAVGLYLTAAAGPAVIAIGLASIAAGIAYTAGPFPLAYLGLGDLFVLLFFGFVAVCGTVFVQMETVTPLAVAASIPVGALATAILVVNNVRDRHTDVLAGKRTLAVRTGKLGGCVEYGALVASAVAVPLALWWAGAASAWVLLPVVTAPWAVWLTVQLVRREGAALNPILGGTAQLLLVHGVLFALGLAVG